MYLPRGITSCMSNATVCMGVKSGSEDLRKMNSYLAPRLVPLVGK